MRSFQEWIEDYSKSHQNPQNKKIHNVCVPAITFSLLGLLYTVPYPQNLQWEIFNNWAILFILPSLMFYWMLNKKIFIGMLLQTVLYLSVLFLIQDRFIIFWLSLILFILAWIGQFYGHKIEGKKPSFFKDLLFLMIGPIWVVKNIYDKLGIRY